MKPTAVLDDISRFSMIQVVPEIKEERRSEFAVLCDSLKLGHPVLRHDDKFVYTSKTRLDDLESFDVLLSFLSLREVIVLSRCSRALGRIFGKHEFGRCVQLGNISPELRIPFWIENAPHFEFERELRARLEIKVRNTYDELIR